MRLYLASQMNGNHRLCIPLQEVSQYAPPQPVSNELLFSEVYHALIHSPALETLLNLEHTYALAVGDVIDRRDRDLVLIEKRSNLIIMIIPRPDTEQHQ